MSGALALFLDVNMAELALGEDHSDFSDAMLVQCQDRRFAEVSLQPNGPALAAVIGEKTTGSETFGLQQSSVLLLALWND